MADIVTSEKRSRMMSGIRGKDTQGELIIRRGLHHKGFRFRLHVSKLPGKPDIVFPKYKAVIMFHGCFWHGHDCYLFKWPSSRIEFWENKIEGNRKRDRDTLAKLAGLGWRVLVMWECAIKGKDKWPLAKVFDVTANWIEHGGQFFEVRG